MFEKASKTTFSPKIAEKYYERLEEPLIDLRCNQERYVELLWQYSENPDARALATTFSKCEPNNRCRSVACAYCYNAARRFFRRQRERRVSALFKRLGVNA